MSVDVTVYNVGPFGDLGRGLDDLVPEMNAIMSNKPDISVYLETIGWGPLPNYEDYVKIRDRTTEGRANITMYIHKSLKPQANRALWIPCDLTWRMTRAGAGPGDRHPPREILRVNTEKVVVFGSHDPPVTKFHDTEPARREHLQKVSHAMAPWLRDTWEHRTPEEKKTARKRLRVNLGDPNGQGPELAKLVGGWYEGTNIEGGTVVGGTWRNAHTQKQVAGRLMKSDHKRMFMGTLVDS